MTLSEFVRNLWENSDDYTTRMDIDTARQDLDNFRRSEFDMPEGITPEDYMEAWNELVDENTPKLWYAIMKDSDDFDWGTGTYDKEEAVRRVKSMLNEYPDAYIAVIQEGLNPVCVDEITDF